MQNDSIQVTECRVLKRSPYIVERQIHGSSFLIDITDNYSENKCALYEINDVGSFIWNCIDGQRSVTAIAMELQKAITDDIDLQILVDDSCEFIVELMSRRFVEV